jgi:excisionase family DNA binding protein
MAKKNRNKARSITQAQKQRQAEKQAPESPKASPVVSTEQPMEPVKPPVGGMSAPLLLTISDLCGLLNVSRSTVNRLDKSGELPGRLQLGGQVRYHREVVETWLLKRATMESRDESTG